MNIDALISLYNELQRDGILVFECSQKSTKAVTIRNQLGCGIFIDTNHIETVAEELSALAHEYGHCAIFQRESVRPSMKFYLHFSLAMGRSPGFGSYTSNLSPYSDLQIGRASCRERV